MAAASNKTSTHDVDGQFLLNWVANFELFPFFFENSDRYYHRSGRQKTKDRRGITAYGDINGNKECIVCLCVLPHLLLPPFLAVELNAVEYSGQGKASRMTAGSTAFASITLFSSLATIEANTIIITTITNMVGGYEEGRRGCELPASRNKQQQGEQAPSPTPSPPRCF